MVNKLANKSHVKRKTHSKSPTNSPNSLAPRRTVVMWDNGMKQLTFTVIWYRGRVSCAWGDGTRIMEFREMGEKEYVIVSVGGWAVSYLVRGIQSTMYGVGRTYLLGWIFGRSWLAWGSGLISPCEDDLFKRRRGYWSRHANLTFRRYPCLNLQVREKEVTATRHRGNLIYKKPLVVVWKLLESFVMMLTRAHRSFSYFRRHRSWSLFGRFV